MSRLACDRIYAGERLGFARRVGLGELPMLAKLLLQHWRSGRAAARPT